MPVYIGQTPLWKDLFLYFPSVKHLYIWFYLNFWKLCVSFKVSLYRLWKYTIPFFEKPDVAQWQCLFAVSKITGIDVYIYIIILRRRALTFPFYMGIFFCNVVTIVFKEQTENNHFWEIKWMKFEISVFTVSVHGAINIKCVRFKKNRLRLLYV